jgi:hypothetical protein
MLRLFIDVKKSHTAVRMKVFHSALTEFSITLKIMSRDGVSTDGAWIGYTLANTRLSPSYTVNTHRKSSHSSLPVAW